MASRTLVIKTKMDNTEYTAQIKKLERQINDLTQDIEENANTPLMSSSELEEASAKLEKLTNQLQKLKEKQKEVEDTSPDLNFDNFGAGIEKSVKSISRMVLALFSVRTLMGLISNATSIVSQNNEGLANQIESIKYTLAMALEPVITRIVGWVQTLVQWVGYLAKAWFGVDIFANASAKASQKMAKSAKEAKKQLAGFDEMNVVSDNSSSSAGATGGGISGIEPLPEGEVPEWLKWIGEHKDLFKEIGLILLGIAGYVQLLKLGLEGIQALGIMVTITGIVMLIQDIIDFIKDPSWSKFGEILTDIGIILAGLAITIGSIPLAVAAAVALITGFVITHWDQIKEILGIVGSWIYDHVISPVVSFFSWLFSTIITIVKNIWNGVVGIVSGIANWIYQHIISPIANFFSGLWSGLTNGLKVAYDKIVSLFTSLKTKITSIFSTIVTMFKNIGTKVGDAIGSAFKSVINAVLGKVEKILNTPINGINKLINKINDVPGINLSKLDTFSFPRLAQGGIVNNPGRGVNIGGAIAGEAGAEAVLPLTNPDTMAMIGEAIGKFVTINLTNNTQLDGRTIARQLNTINNSKNFILNR